MTDAYNLNAFLGVRKAGDTSLVRPIPFEARVEPDEPIKVFAGEEYQITGRQIQNDYSDVLTKIIADLARKQEEMIAQVAEQAQALGYGVKVTRRWTDYSCEITVETSRELGLTERDIFDRGFH